jgi:UDP-glucose 4-epimerase
LLEELQPHVAPIRGEQDEFPAAEDHPTRPGSPYGVSKRAGELYLGYYYQAFGVPYLALRYANVYGPRQSSKGEAGVVAIFISQLVQGNSPTINGDGQQTRDYVFVGDVVRANLVALECDYVGPVNIGTGKETDVVTICQELRKGLGSSCEAIHGPAKVGVQKRSCLDATLAAKVLDWKAKVPLDEGLRTTLSWWRESAPQ